MKSYLKKAFFFGKGPQIETSRKIENTDAIKKSLSY